MINERPKLNMELDSAAIGIIKITNIIFGFIVHRQFAAVHSALNRLTGLLLFLLPLTLSVVDIKFGASLACAVATLAAIQEGHLIRTNPKGDIHYESERHKGSRKRAY